MNYEDFVPKHQCPNLYRFDKTTRHACRLKRGHKGSCITQNGKKFSKVREDK